MSGCILVADDNAANREVLEGMLSLEGYEVATATNGREALSEFVRLQPDLVLLDVKMPYLDGFQVCQVLKGNAETRLVPVVMVTSLSASEDRVRGIEAGADDFLNKPIDRNELLARVRSLLSLKAYTDELERAESVLYALALSIEAKDPYTQGHCDRLSDFSTRLAKNMGLPEKEIEALRRAGIVHDVGKVAVPEAILLKPGPLTHEERMIMQEHPVVGERICAPLKSFKLVLPIVRHHHEKLDGSGYPDALQGDQIPLTARIMSIVDVYDALTTNRPYRRALTLSEAFTLMREEAARGWWDPALLDIFESVAVVSPVP